MHTDYDPNTTLCGSGHSVTFTINQSLAFGQLCRMIDAETQAEALRYMAQVAFECLGLLPRSSATERVPQDMIDALQQRHGDALDPDPYTGANTTQED